MIAFDKTPYQIDFTVPYINVVVLVFQKEKLVDINRYPKIVIDATHDGWIIEEVQLHINQIDYHGEAVILTNEFGSFNENVIFFPYWLYRNSIRFNDQPVVPIGKRLNKVSCLNRSPSSSRLYLYYQLLQRPYESNLMLSLHGLVCPYSRETLTLDHDRFNNLPIEIKNQLRNINLVRQSFPGDNGNDFNEPGNPGDHNWLHPAFSNTYLNIITESVTEAGFYSEKTFKPLAAGQLFFMLSAANATRPLKLLGFETFDDNFNNHEYEQSMSYTERSDQLVNLLDSIYSNIEEIYFSNLPELRHNQQYAFSDTFRERILQPLRDRDLI
jgi:hypothetical protein